MHVRNGRMYLDGGCPWTRLCIPLDKPAKPPQWESFLASEPLGTSTGAQRHYAVRTFVRFPKGRCVPPKNRAP